MMVFQNVIVSLLRCARSFAWHSALNRGCWMHDWNVLNAIRMCWKSLKCVEQLEQAWNVSLNSVEWCWTVLNSVAWHHSTPCSTQPFRTTDRKLIRTPTARHGVWSFLPQLSGRCVFDVACTCTRACFCWVSESFCCTWRCTSNRSFKSRPYDHKIAHKCIWKLTEGANHSANNSCAGLHICILCGSSTTSC
jgi:hypothetical protein